ncbi:MAG: TonB-dependent receptor [Gammaproteobacteria bacterium]|nr:TonB-dependent receptor [Gammaproteobacteria bacterium]
MTSLRPVRPAQTAAHPGFSVAARRALAKCARAASFAALLYVLTLVSVTAAAAQQTGTLTGRVLEHENSRPIPDVVVRLHDLGLSTVTDADGMFRFTDVPEGAHILVVEHLAYGDQSREIAVNPGEDLRLDVRLAARTIELEPLVVEAVTELERRRISTGHSINEVGPAQLSEAARRGLGLSEVLAQHLPGLRVRSGRTGSCVEYRSTSAQGGCNEVSVYVDGVRSAAPSLLYFSMPLEDIARVELLSPLQASTRFGMAAGGGALLVETKTGPQRQREAAADNLVTGFDWSLEEERYGWERVFASSFVGNAVGLAVGLGLANQCLEIDTGLGGLRPRCTGILTTGTGILALALPSAAGGYSAGWAGQTDRSKGRFLPAALGSAMAATAGYLLLIEGRSNEAGAAETAGIVLLAVGTPLMTTVADRIFRVLR